MLEEELAVLLLDRGSPRLSLTPAGRQLYRLALPMVVGMDLLPDTFADLHYGIVSGELHIAAGEVTAQFVLPGYVKRFHALHPTVEVHVRTGAGPERLRWLRNHEVDVVLSASDSPPPDLVFRFLIASEYVIITPEDHPLAGRESVTMEETCSHPGVLPPRASPLRRLMELYARQHGMVIRAAVEIGGWDAIKRHVALEDPDDRDAPGKAVRGLRAPRSDHGARVPAVRPEHGAGLPGGGLRMAVAEERTAGRQRDRLRQLRSFCRVARHGSIAEAAELLLLDAPVVSLHLRELEHEAGTPLLDRGGPRIALTPAGERFLELALPLVDGMDGLAAAFTAQIDNPASGVVRLAASPACALYALPPFVKRFRDRYPGIRVCVEVEVLQRALPLVRTGEVEFAFSLEEIVAEGVLYHRVSHFEMVLIAPEDHALAGCETVSWEEIAAWPVIMPTVMPASGVPGPRFLETVGSGLARARVAVRARDLGAIKRYVEAGIGVAVFPSFGVAEGDRVAVVPLRESVELQSYGLFMQAGRQLSPEAERLARSIDPGLPPGRLPSRQ